jgi:hypothetical protein
VEVWLGGDPAVQRALEDVGAYLSGQIDGECLGDRDHAFLPREHLGIAHAVDRLEHETRIAVDELVQPTRTHGPAGDDLAGTVGLADARDHAALDQLDEGLGDDVGVNAEVAPVGKVAKHLVRDASEADLERRAILDDARNVAGDSLSHCADRRVDVLDHRGLHGDDAVEPIDGHEAVTPRPRHVRVDLRDNHASGAQRLLGDVN